MAKGYLLSEGDVLIVRQLVQDYHSRRGMFAPSSPGTRYQGDDDGYQTPEVYAARVPSGGIPALTGSTPGSVEADLYALTRTGSTGSLAKYPGFRQRLWNLSTTAVSGDSWALAVRHKDGSWFAVPTAVAASAGPGAIGDHGCQLVKGSSQSVSSGGSFTILNWDSESYDTDAYHSLVTNVDRITIPSGQAGKYAVGAQVQWNNLATAGAGDGEFVTCITVDSTETLRDTRTIDSGVLVFPGTVDCQVRGIITLSVGSILRVQVYQTTGVALTPSTTALTHFNAQRLT